MRKVMCCALLVALAAANSGCVVAMGNKGSLKACKTHDRQAVAINGDIYVVDMCSGQVTKIDSARVGQATTFTAVSVETTETDND